MITAIAYQEPIETFVQSHTQPQVRSREERRPDRILVAEHRDEVFARLAADLRELGYTVFRASRADEVCRMYTYGQIELVLYNFDLPCEDAWMSVRKLRLFDAYARIWLYVPWRSTLAEHDANLSRIERRIYYQGDLFHLADQIEQSLFDLRPGWWSTGLRHSAKATMRHWEQTT